MILEAFFKDGTVVPTDPNDKKLQAKINKFKKYCDKYYVDDWVDGHLNKKCFGVLFRPLWDEKYGFTFQFEYDPPFYGEGHHTIDEALNAFKQQAKILKKHRHNLAILIRLKQRFQLPGPIQEIRERDDKVGYRYIPLPQEEIDHILKY